jgi:endonuclease/exonuclease/phosphatase family metal-dependent hydrolase
MTWNVWWRFGPEWRDRQPGLVHTIGAVDSDVVALQEVSSGRDSRGSGSSSSQRPSPAAP